MPTSGRLASMQPPGNIIMKAPCWQLWIYQLSIVTNLVMLDLPTNKVDPSKAWCVGIEFRWGLSLYWHQQVKIAAYRSWQLPHLPPHFLLVVTFIHHFLVAGDKRRGRHTYFTVNCHWLLSLSQGINFNPGVCWLPIGFRLHTKLQGEW